MVLGMESYIKRVSLMLTLIKGHLVAGWTHDMGTWVDALGPQDDIPAVWDQFLHEFDAQCMDTQRAERARMALQSLRMKWPEIDQYIADFEQLAREANYTVGNEETVQFFVQGLVRSVAEDVLKPPLVQTYAAIKERAIESTKARQTIYQIFGNQRQGQGNRPPPRQTWSAFPHTNQPRVPFFRQNPTYQPQPQGNPQPRGPQQYNSSNAPPHYVNAPVVKVRSTYHVISQMERMGRNVTSG